MARKIIGSVWDRENRNAINDNFEELYGYKNTADSAKEAADYAVNTAEFAKAKAESVQAQFNQVVIEGDSSVEAAQARVGADGTVYETLKERLDAEYNEVNDMLTQARVDAEGKSYPTLKARLDAKETEFSSQLAQSTEQLEAKKMDKDTKDISVTQINKNLGKLDQTYMSEEFLQQIAGNAPINTVPADRTIEPIKTTFMQTGKNLFNKFSRKLDFYVSATTGELSASTRYDASDFIPVEPSTTYTRGSTHQMAFYNSLKEFIGGLSGDGTETFTTPVDAKFVRVTVPKSDVNTYQIEKGEVKTAYEPFSYELNAGREIKIYSEPKDGSLTTEKYADKSITHEKISFLKSGKNLFNKKTAIENHIIRYDVGDVYPSVAGYYASDFIPVKPSTTYVRTTDHQMAFYDKNMNYISGLTSDFVFTTPANCYFIRVTIPGSEIEKFQIEEGTVRTAYEPYKVFLDKKQSIIIEDAVEEIPKENLIFWVKADSLEIENGNSVFNWQDSSLNGYDLFAENPPVFREDVYNGLPTVEFISADISKKMVTNEMKPILNNSDGAVVFIVAEKFSTLEYPLSERYETPFFVSMGESSAFLRFELRDKFEVHGRRVDGEGLMSAVPNSVGLTNVTYGLSLYEAHIDFENGTCELYQDGRFLTSADFKSAGITKENVLSYLSVGDVTDSGGYVSGFNGNVSEIVFYNQKKQRKDIKKVRNYLMDKWGIHKLDSKFYAKYETISLNDGITSKGKNLALIAIKSNIDMNVKEAESRFETEGYLYLDEESQKLYYSAGKHDNPQYLCDWDMTLTGEPCENYVPTISRDGDIIFLHLRSRGNPVVYPSGDYNNPVMIDFSDEEAPMAGLMDTGVEWDYEKNFLLFAEYWNPAQSGKNQYIWKVTSPFTEKANWRKVFTQLTQMPATPIVDGAIRHFHTLKRDFYTGAWYANTGDVDYQCKTFESTDDGETWNLVGGGSQADRMTGLIFLKEGAYWGTDSHTDHALYFAPRKEDGLIDFKNYKRLAWLSLMQPTYRTCYVRNPNGILFLDRAEERLDYKLDVTFWSFEHNRLYRLDVLNAIEGDTGERDGRFGFGNQAVTAYQPNHSNGIICGATSNWLSRPMTLKILGNSIDKRVNNVKIEVLEKE